MQRDHLERRLQALEHSVQGKSSRNWNYLLPIAIGTAAFFMTAVAVMLDLSSFPHNSNQAALTKIQSATSYQLYYPAKLPGYYFMLTSSVSQQSGVVQFSIQREDGQTIQVAEQYDGGNFDITQVNGTKTTILGVGTMVVGPGFLGDRAVIRAGNTLVILSSPSSISMTDLTSIGKGFKPVGKAASL